jgi:hypothetical protein
VQGEEIFETVIVRSIDAMITNAISIYSFAIEGAVSICSNERIAAELGSSVVIVSLYFIFHGVDINFRG